jgi:hypothetical protein
LIILGGHGVGVFNSLRRWLSPGQLEQLIGSSPFPEPEGDNGQVEPIGFGQR